MKTASFTESLTERLEAARENLAHVQERVGELCEQARDKVAAGAKVTDKAIRKHPYESVAIALGVGVLVGVFLGRRK